MSSKKISRREFIILSSLALAGGLAARHDATPLNRIDGRGHGDGCKGGGRHGGGCRGGGGTIDPPPGGPFRDPVEMANVSSTPGVFEAVVDAKVTSVNINGTTANLLTYNSSFPGPTVCINKGDLLKLHFKNSLLPTSETSILGFQNNVTNLHTHGLHVSPSGNSDNVFLHFEPGEEFLFEYDTRNHEAGNLNWYHPHRHGLVSEQLWGGLAGALVVEDDIGVLSSYETHILILKDISLSGSEPAPHTSSDYRQGKEGDVVMVNGQVNPALPIRPGQVQRWRILNASTARYYKLSLENHTMYLVGTDTNLLDQPYPITEILLTPGERIDILVRADQSPGTSRLLSLPYNRGRNALQTVTLMTMSYEGSPLSESVPFSINPNAERLELDIGALPRKTFVLTMRMGRGQINGQDFDVNPYTATSTVGTYEVWEIVNMTMMDHPFHQHVNAAQILSINGGDPAYASLYTSIPGLKDTINVPRMHGSVEMLVSVKDFTGPTVFHCHIVEHEDIGMMGIWELV
jgi:FtsP/CotA-like multicopper oxidase with cupredoxin domain